MSYKILVKIFTNFYKLCLVNFSYTNRSNHTTPFYSGTCKGTLLLGVFV